MGRPPIDTTVCASMFRAAAAAGGRAYEAWTVILLLYLTLGLIGSLLEREPLKVGFGVLRRWQEN